MPGPLPDADDLPTSASSRSTDAARFEAIIRAHTIELCAFARRYIGSSEQAEDVVQEVFCRLWERRSHWPQDSGLRAYLYKMTRNLALDRLRHAGVERSLGAHSDVLAELPWMGAPQIPADERLSAEELAAAIDRAVEQLPARCRLVFTLRWKQHLSYAEIAQIMGISVKGVEIQRARGIKAIRALLAPFADD